MVIFVKKRPEITSKHLYFDRNPGIRLYSNLYLKNIDEFCLFCTLYLKNIDEVQVHGTFVLEMKIDLKYNLGYRMILMVGMVGKVGSELRKKKTYAPATIGGSPLKTK